MSCIAVTLTLAGCAPSADRAAIGSIDRGSAAIGSLLPRLSLAMLEAETSGSLSNGEAEAVMARAIAEHEMRRP